MNRAILCMLAVFDDVGCVRNSNLALVLASSARYKKQH
jgi:hypothetical protein